jgi:hypothetical protein
MGRREGRREGNLICNSVIVSEFFSPIANSHRYILLTLHLEMNLLSYSGRECSLVKYVESSLAMPIQFFK